MLKHYRHTHDTVSLGKNAYKKFNKHHSGSHYSCRVIVSCLKVWSIIAFNYGITWTTAECQDRKVNKHECVDEITVVGEIKPYTCILRRVKLGFELVLQLFDFNCVWVNILNRVVVV